MNFRKTILYLLGGIFLLIFVYNYILPYFVVQNSVSMGMGMGSHMNEGVYSRPTYYYGNIINVIIIIIIIVAALVILNKIIFDSNGNKCRKCGLPIESDKWKICPRCGNHLYDNGRNK